MSDSTETKPAAPGPRWADLEQLERSFESIADLEASAPTIADLEAGT